MSLLPNQGSNLANQTPDISLMTQDQQKLYYDNLIKNQGMGAMDYMNLAAGGIGAGINVASFFANKKGLDAQIAGIKDNITGAKEERAYRSKFRTDTATAFA